MTNDALGERMKSQYEDRTRFMLPRRTYTIIRVDGKAFHSFTKGLKKPFDHNLMGIMDSTARALCEAIQGAVLAYTQSDEISVLLTDFATPQTEAWFDGNVQKIASIAASIATMAFNQEASAICDVWEDFSITPTALFDARVFTIPDPVEVQNYFVWRQQDAVRNSIQAAAQSVYSHKELHGKNTSQLQEMLFQKGINWNDYTSGEKRGRAIVKQTYTMPAHTLDVYPHVEVPETTRSKWVSLSGGTTGETPTFTADRDFLRSRIPLIGASDDA